MISLDIFKDEFNTKKLFYNEPMKNHTSFKIGGNADLLILPEDVSDIINILNICKKNNIPYYIIGNGSNLLVRDNGFRGVIIKIYNNFNNIKKVGENEIMAQSGALLSTLANEALANELTGIEFASGIPGTVGGGVFMNAGAYDGEMKDVIYTVDLLTDDLKIITLKNEEMDFAYRTSLPQKNGWIILSTNIKLEKGSYSQIKEKMKDLNSRRKEKQPLEMPSAGSTFKRPQNHYAGKLIMDSGLKGYCIGDAQVSEKHCGFVINKGNATAEDVINLIEHIKTTVINKFGVNLETELRIIGE